MNRSAATPKISFLLLSLLTPFTVSTAQEVPRLGSQDIGSLQYAGADARIGVAYQNGGGWRGEVFGVLSESSNNAWLGDAWFSNSSGGLQLSYHLAADNFVQKYFVAVDQNKAQDRKISLGTGVEGGEWFGHGYVSYSPSDRRQLGAAVDQTELTQIRGSENGRDFLDDVSTTTTTRIFEQAYKYGIGARIGYNYTPQNLRLTAGIDFERGIGMARQLAATLNAEKFFIGTPHSIALQGNIYHKTGSFDLERNERRVTLTYRYSFGKNTSDPIRNYRDVPQVNVAAPPIVIPAHSERRLVKTSSSMNGDAFFRIGSAKLTELAKQELDRLAEILMKSPHEGNVHIVGHTCDLGSSSMNDRLSLQRAFAVRDYLLIKKVLNDDEIVLEGKGASEPKYPNVTGSREKNRRVDLEFVSVQESEEVIQIPEKVQTSSQPAVTYVRELIKAEPSWLRRALRTPADHKREIDTYQTQQKTQVSSTARSWINRAPKASDDAYQVVAGSTTALSVLSNDVDPDSDDVLSIVSVKPASNGTVRIDGRQLVYTAPEDFKGTVNFSYIITDSHGASSEANVVINVTAPNRAPVAVDDRFTVSGTSSSRLDVLANDSDPDGDALTIVGVTQPISENGTVSIVDNKIDFSPSRRFSWDTITYTVSDGRGGFSTATVLLIDP